MSFHEKPFSCNLFNFIQRTFINEQKSQNCKIHFKLLPFVVVSGEVSDYPSVLYLHYCCSSLVQYFIHSERRDYHFQAKNLPHTCDIIWNIIGYFFSIICSQSNDGNKTTALRLGPQLCLFYVYQHFNHQNVKCWEFLQFLNKNFNDIKSFFLQLKPFKLLIIIRQSAGNLQLLHARARYQKAW